MQSVFYDLLELAGRLADTEIISANIDNQRNFRLTFEYWPDIYEYSGDRSLLVITAYDAKIETRFEPDMYVGYEVRDILLNSDGAEIQINTTVRVIKMKAKQIVFSAT
ncbi:MAG: hypothetical protein ACJAWC_002531 [Yoonia sp.]|jgi:hypothetical protein